MKALLVAITAGALSLISSGQDARPADPSDQNASVLNGADLVGELNKSIDSKKVKPGDTVKGTVTQDVLAHGKIIIPRRSKLPVLRLSREQGSQSVVTSTTQNVKLDSGTQIVIQIINLAQ